MQKNYYFIFLITSALKINRFQKNKLFKKVTAGGLLLIVTK